MTARVILDRKARQICRELHKMALQQPIPQRRAAARARTIHPSQPENPK